MTSTISKIYPAKLLLFGEYSVIHGGDSLAIPYSKKHAFWSYDSTKEDVRLHDFLLYLKSLKNLDLDLERFESELENGLFLASTIPVGYGAGSSGSVVAAVYDRYLNSKKSIELSELRSTFAMMESFFHGSSSGLDPLVSYLDTAIYIHKGEVTTSDLSVNSILSKLYLFDTSKSRSTSKLVAWYKEQLESKDFVRNVSDPMIKLSTSIISVFLEQNEELFAKLFESLSMLQKDNLMPMFPPEIKNDLEKIRNDIGGSFKLCGAGGGGYFLGYLPSYDVNKTPTDLSKAIRPIL